MIFTRIAVFWDVALCRSCGNRRSSETLVHTRSTQHHIPDDGILHSHSCDYAKTSTLTWSLQFQKLIFNQSDKLQDLNIQTLNYNYQSLFTTQRCSLRALLVPLYISKWHSNSIHIFCRTGNLPFIQTTCLTELFVKKHKWTLQKVDALQVPPDTSARSFHAPGFTKPEDTSLFPEMSSFSRLQCPMWQSIATTCAWFDSKLLSCNWMSEVQTYYLAWLFHVKVPKL
jgi:hypothetical protein